MSEFLKSGSPVGLDPKTIYKDMLQPIIVLKDGFIVIPFAEAKDLTKFKKFCDWTNEVNKKWFKPGDDGMQTRIFTTKSGKKDQYVLIPTTVEEFMNSLSDESKSITKTITDRDKMSDILEGKVDLMPSESEIESMVKKGFIRSGKYSSEEGDSAPEKEDPEEDDEDDESLQDTIFKIISDDLEPATTSEVTKVRETSEKIIKAIQKRLK